MSDSPVILVAGTDRAEMEILAPQLEGEGYEMALATSMEEMDRVIGGDGEIALSLVDISGFDEVVWERCDRLRELEVPFIVLSSQRSAAVQRDSIRHGAGCLLLKPVGARELMEYIHTLLGDWR